MGIFSIFEMRLLLMIWKARRPQAFAEGWANMRRELGILYARFYCSMLLGIALLYQFWGSSHVLVFAAFSFWIPQICLNAYLDSSNPFEWPYMIGMSVSRLALPVYLWTCHDNLAMVVLGGATPVSGGS